MFKKYKIESTIGIGNAATVFKIKHNHKYYALRKLKIYNHDVLFYKENFKYNKILENIHADIYRQIDFNKINNMHFTIIYKYLIEKCSFQ